MDDIIIAVLCGTAVLAWGVICYREGRKRGATWDAIGVSRKQKATEQRLRQELTALKIQNAMLQRAKRIIEHEVKEVSA